MNPMNNLNLADILTEMRLHAPKEMRKNEQLPDCPPAVFMIGYDLHLNT